MAYNPTYPILLDEVLTISTTILKAKGFLELHKKKSGVITWSRNGQVTGRVAVVVDTLEKDPYAEFDYSYSGTPVNLKVRLVSIQSNIGNSPIWYFLCPLTGKPCRKLYAIGSEFVHRAAIKGCMYKAQTHSHSTRMLFKFFKDSYSYEGFLKEITKPNFKKYYNGKHTKRYQKLLSSISFGDSDR